MKTLFVSMFGLLVSLHASSQILKPVTWSYAVKKTSATDATVFVKAAMQDGWHIYSLEPTVGGPVKTTFTFAHSKSFRLKGAVSGPAPKTKYESAFGVTVKYYEDTVVFQQKITLRSKTAIVQGTVQFMVCSAKQCIPPATTAFLIPVN